VLLTAKIRVGLVGLTVAGGAAAVLVLGQPGPAVGQSSPPIQVQLQVNSPATLAAKGAGVNVSVTVTCSGPVGPGGLVVVELVENDKGNIAYGYGEGSPSCTGASQTLELLVTAGNTGPSGIAQGPSAAFAKGVAIADTGIQECNASGSTCASQQVQPVIKIKK
jgi:hypothetical protein